MHLDFLIRGRAVPKQSVKSGNGHWYTPDRIVRWQARVRDACAMAMREQKQTRVAHDVPMAGEIIAYYRRPKGKVQHAAQAVWPIVRGDVDNVSKAILDAMNGVAYVDDKQVVSLGVHRRYCVGVHEEPYVRVRLWEAGCGKEDWVQRKIHMRKRVAA